jgi:hypothetical protein
MSFFRQFPKVDYNFSEAGFDTLVTDIFRFVQADLPAISDSTTYQYYQIQDGDRPDIVSNKLYGTPDYYWTFFLCNESLKTGLTGWPMSQNQFDKYILTEYDGTALITYPSSPVYNTDHTQIIAQYNSLAGKFIIGETISAGNSLETKHTGLLYSKDSNLSQLILRNTSGVGSFMDEEQIIGHDSGDTVYIGKVYDWKDAPHHYIKNKITDTSGALITAGNFVIGEDYFIVSARDTDFVTLGAANNNFGTNFTATGTGGPIPDGDVPGTAFGPLVDLEGNLLSDSTISYNALYIDEQNNALGIDNPPDVIDTDLTPISNLEYETELNDSRSKIRVVRPKMIYAFAQAYKKLLNA